MKIYGVSMEFGCAKRDPYENMYFFNEIRVVWEEIHMKIHGFPMEFGLCGRRPI